MISRFKRPQAYLLGYTEINHQQLVSYLRDTDQIEFLDDLEKAKSSGLSNMEVLCSFYAKLCYSALTTKKNDNISKTRSIADNIRGTINSGHGCYDRETEVLTNSGWKFWPDVSDQDLLMTLRPSTGYSEFQRPTKLISYHHKGEIVKVEGQGIDLLVTPCHKMWACKTTTKEGRRKKDYKLIRADCLEGSHSYQKSCNTLSKGEEYSEYKLLGFSIGDGSSSGNLITFNLKKKRKIEYLKSICKNLGLVLKGKGGRLSVNISSLSWSPCEIYDFSLEKQIPDHTLMSLSNSIYNDRALSLLDGLINSDGSISETCIIYDTTSKKLAGQIQWLSLLCGYAANISQAKCYKKRDNSFGDKPINRLTILKRNLKPDIKNSTKGSLKIYTGFDDFVYCAEVPNHVLYVRRNGKPVWSGNSVFEHASFNFVVTDCSRVFTHELVRHRVGTAFSQTSGRYVRGEKVNFVHDPILNDVLDDISGAINDIEKWYKQMVDEMIQPDMDFATKKKITSALRRILPNGQTNEIGFSCNLRSLRHIITMRTSRHAEWEIRFIFNQIVDLVKPICPVFFEDVEEVEVDGLNEVIFKFGAI